MSAPIRRIASILAAGFLCVSLPQASFAAANGSPFAKLNGSWRGSGQIRFNDGSAERLSCHGYYNDKAGNTQLSLAIRCQSATHQLNMRGSLDYHEGRVRGHWEERTFNAEGNVSGRATPNWLSLAITGPVSGSMRIAVNPSSHQVSINTGGVGFKSVSISFRRG
jgi:hypothetical protein